ncbi:hypothetical protein FBU30_009393 [Linnemannia zychae]|nr:hypothetical protein FBU30_009393 [Linnemannia zychae]
MALLSGFSNLKILNLAGLKISDTGLGHLIRSVTFGSLGPMLLEYLNLAGTDVSHRGIARLWSSPQPQQQGHSHKQLVFQHLLGIDLSGTAVLPNLAATLFQEQEQEQDNWIKLDNNVELFSSRTLQEQRSSNQANYPNCYFEKDTGMNPMQKWVDRLNRTYKLTFGQRPDIAGEDGLGLSECLALSKLSQIHFLPLSEPLAPHQIEYIRRGEEMKRIFAEGRQSRKRTRYGRFKEDNSDINVRKQAARGKHNQQLIVTDHALSDKNAIIGENGLDHMFNLNMYQKILASVQLTFGTRFRPVTSSGKSAGNQEGLAFVRLRSVVEKQLMAEDVEMDEVQYHSQQRQYGTASKGRSSGVGPNGVEVATIARLKARYHRWHPIKPIEPINDETAIRNSFNGPNIVNIKQENNTLGTQECTQHDNEIRPRFTIQEDRDLNDCDQEDHSQDSHQTLSSNSLDFLSKTIASTSSAATNRTSSWVFSSSTSPIKQKMTMSQQTQGPPISNLPTRRRVGQNIKNSCLSNPFIKPAVEQTSSAIFIRQPSPRKDDTPKQQKVYPTGKPMQMIKTRADQRSAMAPRSTPLMIKNDMRRNSQGRSPTLQWWIKQEEPPSKTIQSLSTSASPTKNKTLKGSNKNDSKTSFSTATREKPVVSPDIIEGGQPVVIREFHFNTTTKHDTVSLDRWIRNGKK